MNKKIKLGKKGEKMAEKFLVEKGLEILEKNYRVKMGEIDLICLEHSTIVFVEVKTRSNREFGFPEEAINERKKQKLKIVADCYISDYRNKNNIKDFELDCRFDIISVYLALKDENSYIKLIKNAF